MIKSDGPSPKVQGLLHMSGGGTVWRYLYWGEKKLSLLPTLSLRDWEAVFLGRSQASAKQPDGGVYSA